MRSSTRAVLATALAIGAAALAPAAASAWAPADSATIHPGIQTETAGSGQCTANFIFTRGSDTYIGQAAHCASTGAATDTDGCLAQSLPLGTKVTLVGSGATGTLAYSSWLTMQGKGETDADACAYNDLALVKIDPADVSKVNPSVPGFGGPTGLGSPGGALSDVYSYGNSSLRGGITQLSPKQGKLIQTSGNGWNHTLYTLTPGIPGDSGSGFLSSTGAAFGTLSTVAIAPLPASNGVGDLSKELAYANANGFSGTALANGTEPFTPNIVGAILGAG
ncbi:MAG TPA: hypothetical protein VFY44_07795 [Thermoleophilaceae bacterium]|nr:hypothetical protein [Thermoleophilaceae bacterium]